MANSELLRKLHIQLGELRNSEQQLESRVRDMERSKELGTKFANLQWSHGCRYGEVSMLEDIIKLLQQE